MEPIDWAAQPYEIVVRERRAILEDCARRIGELSGEEAPATSRGRGRPPKNTFPTAPIGALDTAGDA